MEECCQNHIKHFSTYKFVALIIMNLFPPRILYLQQVLNYVFSLVSAGEEINLADAHYSICRDFLSFQNASNGRRKEEIINDLNCYNNRNPSAIQTAVKNYGCFVWQRETNLNSMNTDYENLEVGCNAMHALRTHSRHVAVKVFRVLINDFDINSVKHKAGLVSSPFCQCEQDIETLHHFVFKCKMYVRCREDFIIILAEKRIPTSMVDVINSHDHDVYHALARFVEMSGR